MRPSFYLHLGRRILANRVRRAAGRAEVPYKLVWNATNYCNSRCLTCNVWDIYPSRGGSQNDEIGPAEVARLARSAGPHLLWLAVGGGEPTLKARLADMICGIYDESPRLGLIVVNTNAIIPVQTVRVFEQIARHCRRSEVHAALSLDGVGARHDEIRGVPGNFDKVIETRDRLRELKPGLPNLAVGFQFTVSRFNIDHLDELMDFCRDQGDEFHVTFAQEGELYQNRGDREKILPWSGALPRVLAELAARYRPRRPRDLLQWSHLRLFQRYLESGRSPVPCSAGSSTITLGPMGDMNGCVFLDNAMGNLADFDYDLGRLLATERAREVQRDCRHCDQCWTNCESFPSMLSSPIKTVLRAFSREARTTAGQLVRGGLMTGATRD